MGNLQISDRKIWKFTVQPASRHGRQRHRQTPPHLPLNNKLTIQYDSDTLRKIGNASYHDKYCKILPFGCIQVIRTLRLNAKPISQCHKRKPRKAGQNGVNRVNLIMAKRYNHHDPNIIIATVNAQSIRTKELQISELLRDHSIDALVMTETWLNNKDNSWCETTEINRNGYNLHYRNRIKGKGGGLALICKSAIKVSMV